MRDADIVHAIAAGERDGLSAAYTAYADRLYDYCLRLLADPEAAADTVHDVFLIARERITQLRDPGALRPWLYAIARSQCHRALRRRGRFAPLDEATDMSDPTLPEPETGVHREELRALVRQAVDSLNPREREVIDLTLRHQLDGPGLAAVLGVGIKQANAVAATARAQLHRALGALLVARTRGRDCARLRALVAEWDGRFTPLWRKRVNRHLSKCADCQRSRAVLAAPASLLSALPIATAPAFLHDQLLDNAFDPELVAHHTEFADQAGPYRADGFPDQSQAAAATVGRWASALALAAGLLILAFTGWAALPLLAGQLAGDDRADAVPVVSLTPVSPEPTVSATAPSPAFSEESTRAAPAAPSASQDVSRTTPVTPPRTPRPSGAPTEPSASPASPAPPALAVSSASAQDLTPPGCVDSWTLRVRAHTEGETDAVTLTVTGDFGTQRTAMNPENTPGDWSGAAEALPPGTPVTWTVTASAPDGATATRQGEALRSGCANAPTVD